MSARLFACLAVILASVSTSTTPSRATLDAFLRAHAGSDVPAVVAMIVDKDSTLYSGAFGTQNAAHHRPATMETIFRIASMTKPVTSVAAMLLVDEGKLALDDPVTKYLPEFSKMRVVTKWHDDGTYDARPPSRPIIIRDLLTHTSGMAYSFEDAHLAKLDDGHRDELEFPLLHDPGARFTYGPGPAIVGHIIETISGESLDAFFKHRIFDPLAMSDTGFSVPPDKLDRLVTVQMRESNRSFRELPNPASARSQPRGDGGLFSTAADYCRFMQLFLNQGRAHGVQLLRPETVRLMMSNQIGDLFVTEQPSIDPSIARPFPFGAGTDKFGIGFDIQGTPAPAGLRSAGSVSWGGIQNTHFWIDPTRGMAAVVLMQMLPYYDPKAIDVLRGFERRVNDE